MFFYLHQLDALSTSHEIFNLELKDDHIFIFNRFQNKCLSFFKDSNDDLHFDINNNTTNRSLVLIF